MIIEIQFSFMAKSLVGTEDTETKYVFFEDMLKKKIAAEYPNAELYIDVSYQDVVEQYVDAISDLPVQKFDMLVKEQQTETAKIKGFVEEILKSQNINITPNWFVWQD